MCSLSHLKPQQVMGPPSPPRSSRAKRSTLKTRTMRRARTRFMDLTRTTFQDRLWLSLVDVWKYPLVI